MVVVVVTRHSWQQVRRQFWASNTKSCWCLEGDDEQAFLTVQLESSVQESGPAATRAAQLSGSRSRKAPHVSPVPNPSVITRFTVQGLGGE